MENNINFTDSIFNTEDGIGEQPFVSNIASVFVSLHVQSTLHSLVITHIQYPHTYTHTQTGFWSSSKNFYHCNIFWICSAANMQGTDFVVASSNEPHTVIFGMCLWHIFSVLTISKLERSSEKTYPMCYFNVSKLNCLCAHVCLWNNCCGMQCTYISMQMPSTFYTYHATKDLV